MHVTPHTTDRQSPQDSIRAALGEIPNAPEYLIQEGYLLLEQIFPQEPVPPPPSPRPVAMNGDRSRPPLSLDTGESERDTLTVRAARSDDLEAIYRFYGENRSEFNSIRPASAYEEATENGRFLIIESRRRGIVAAAGMFRHPSGRFLECGAMRSILSRCGLQRLLFNCQLGGLTPGRHDGVECFCTVKPNNSPSIHNIEKSGFLAAEPHPIILQGMREAALRDGGATLPRYYVFPREREAFTRHRRLLEEHRRRGWLVRKTPRNADASTPGEVFSLRIELPIRGDESAAA